MHAIALRFRGNLPRITTLPAALSIVVLVGYFFSASGVHAQPQDRHEFALAERLKARLREANLGTEVGISVLDLASGSQVLEVNANVARNPASNMKVLTAAAALLRLGPQYRFRTGVYGHQVGDAVVGGLYLKGFGDPVLGREHLLDLAKRLAQRGIRKVDELTVDASFFDNQVLPPAFEQQPQEVAPFRAAVGAVSVDRNAYLMRVQPGPTADNPAKVHLDAPGYFKVDNRLRTIESGRLNVVAIQSDDDHKMLLKLRGTVPRGISGASYRRRIESPAPYAGYLFIDALKAARIQVPQRVRLATKPKSKALLVDHVSPPLSQILLELGKHSDNFVAEMLLKALGAEGKAAPGTSQDGAAFVVQELSRMGVNTTGLKIINGSGLFDGNKVTPLQISTLLRALCEIPSVFPEMLSQLAVAGQDGTLHKRMGNLPSHIVVRAKTGTLNGVIALSGYVLGSKPGDGFAFSMLANGVEGKHHAARSTMDDIVLALARVLAQRNAGAD